MSRTYQHRKVAYMPLDKLKNEIEVQATGYKTDDGLNNGSVPDDLLAVTLTVKGQEPIVVKKVPVNTLVAANLCLEAPEKGIYFAAARLHELTGIDDVALDRDAVHCAEMAQRAPDELRWQTRGLGTSMSRYAAEIRQSRSDVATLLTARPDLVDVTSYDKAMALAYGQAAADALTLLGELRFNFSVSKHADNYGDSSITIASMTRGGNITALQVSAGIHQPGIWRTGQTILWLAAHGETKELAEVFDARELEIIAKSGLSNI